LTRASQKIIHAILSRNPEYVRITDWEGKSLTFLLAEEIRPVDKPSGLREEDEGDLP